MLAGLSAGLALPARAGGDPRLEDAAAGDVGVGQAAIWLRTSEPALVEVRWRAGRGRSGMAPALTGPEGDPTAVVALRGLPDDAVVHVGVSLDGGPEQDATSFLTPGGPSESFLWSADLGGQGWGMDPDRGGYPILDAMYAENAGFFVSCGDRIYADDPLPAERAVSDGSVWRNLVADGRDRAAVDEADFRAAYRHHLRDLRYRVWSSETPLLSVWDDHEAFDNFGPVDADARAQAAWRAWTAWTPALLRPGLGCFRVVRRGPLLDVILLDGRSFRSPNAPGVPASWLGERQLRAVIAALRGSRARWKVVVSPQPIAERVHHDFRARTGQDGVADGSPATVAREAELARLLRATRRVRNVVWLTGDVHHAAAYAFDPGRAIEGGFRAFREYVAGPMHAGVFPAGPLDPTFGPRALYQVPVPEVGAGPATGTMSYGRVDIAPDGSFTVRLRDGSGHDLFGERLEPA